MKTISQKFSLLLALAFSCSSIFLTADEYTLYGLSRLSAIEQDHLENHVHKVIEVLPNTIGKARIKAHLEAHNIYADDILDSLSTLEFSTLKITSKKALQKIKKSSSLPTSVNNSLLPSFPPIGNQEQLGSCVGWASTYYQASHELGLLNGFNNKKSFTNVLSPKWTYDMINQGKDHGASPPDAFTLLCTSGAVSILTVPYNTNHTKWDLKTSDWISAISNRMAPYVLIPGLDGNITAIKQSLNNGHVLTFSTFIDSWVLTHIKHDPTKLDNYHEGELACIYMKGQSGGHFMTIVGYDDNLWIDINGDGKIDSGERGAFLVANSWGTDWGNKGFIWISYDAFLTTSAVVKGPTKNRFPAGIGLDSNVISIVPKAMHYSPSLIAEFSISQTKRNQILAQIGFSDTTQTTPVSLIPILNQQGGALEFDGEGSSKLGTVTFAADLTDFLSSESPNINRYYLSISDNTKNDPTILNYFVLVDPVHNKQISSSSTPKTYDNSQDTIYIDYTFTK